ncbi:dehalogenase [Dehalococcoides mccartyi]|jgi:uncharacterized membrane protein|uniref:hypothetical protein n=1 Tax=Dehalococcoides mccartyi TaxID=61435 RepID=UPI0004E0395C|nr:hypothetical protein [Dehalococcoides mccartyi]AII58503.1 dehalogenase [Dehalococcoides mccartyi CG1]APH13112.1 dehalogenase [Dehalococcoides mccartyi]
MIFWEGILFGIVLLGLVIWFLSKKMSLTWYEWLMGIAGIVLLFLAVQNFLGSLAESEIKPAYMILLFMGLPSVVLLVLPWQLATRRAKQP